MMTDLIHRGASHHANARRRGALVCVFAALALSLTACGGEDGKAGLPPGYQANFARACVAQGATEAFCACTWEKIAANISAPDFAALEALPAKQRETHPLQEQINRYAHDCRTYPATP